MNPGNETVPVAITLENYVDFIWSIAVPIAVYSIIICLVVIAWNFSNQFINGLDDEVSHSMMEVGVQSGCRSHVKIIPDAIRFGRYGWMLTILALFYFIPVFQFVVRFYQEDKDRTNCCFNDKCIVEFGPFTDFGGFFSNIGYGVFGLAFITFVALRERRVNTLKLVQMGETHGIFTNFGIFYAIGVSLVAQGIFSATYHICPNKQNFQFDASFMFATALLGYAAMYHRRHEIRFSYGSVIVYIGVGFLVLCTAIGLVTEGLLIDIVFTILYIIGVVVFHLYLWKIRKHLIILSFVVNMLLLFGFWWTKDEADFASRVLSVVLPNFIFQLMYYLYMKCRHDLKYRSWRCAQPLLYFAASLGFCIPAVIAFKNSPKTWERSTTCTKQQLQPCFYESIYDIHGIWHFLSAPGLFFMFMMLLTMDDHMMGVPRKNIRVF